MYAVDQVTAIGVCLYRWKQKRLHLPDLDNDCESKTHIDQNKKRMRIEGMRIC